MRIGAPFVRTVFGRTWHRQKVIDHHNIIVRHLTSIYSLVQWLEFTIIDQDGPPTPQVAAMTFYFSLTRRKAQVKDTSPSMWGYFAFLTLARIAYGLVTPSNITAPIVDVGYARYQGCFDTQTNIANFLGIRYAAPPLGESSDGTLHCSRAGLKQILMQEH